MVIGALKDDAADDAVIAACLTLDTCTATLVQLCEYGAANKLAMELPALADMVGGLGIEPVAAFYVTRKLGKVLAADAAAVLPLQLPGDAAAASTLFALRALYASFWELGLPDLWVPEEQYVKEMQRVKAKHDALQRTPPPYAGGGLDAAAAKAAETLAKKRLEGLKTLKLAGEQLQAEMDAQKVTVAATTARLTAERDAWFPAAGLELEFVQWCLVPRVLFSQEDALFAFTFLRSLVGARNFDVMACLGHVFSCVVKTVFSASEGEAANLAVFVQRTFALLWAWRDDTAAFEAAWPGGDHAGFVAASRVWHDEMALTLASALRGRYLNQRQTVILLKSVSTAFPDTVETADGLVRVLDAVHADESKPDKLRTMCQGLAQQLRGRKNAGKLRVEATGALWKPPPVQRPKAAVAAMMARDKRSESLSRAPSAAAGARPVSSSARSASASQPRASVPHAKLRYDSDDGEVVENGAAPPHAGRSDGVGSSDRRALPEAKRMRVTVEEPRKEERRGDSRRDSDRDRLSGSQERASSSRVDDRAPSRRDSQPRGGAAPSSSGAHRHRSASPSRTSGRTGDRRDDGRRVSSPDRRKDDNARKPAKREDAPKPAPPSTTTHKPVVVVVAAPAVASATASIAPPPKAKAAVAASTVVVGPPSAGNNNNSKQSQASSARGAASVPPAKGVPSLLAKPPAETAPALQPPAPALQPPAQRPPASVQRPQPSVQKPLPQPPPRAVEPPAKDVRAADSKPQTSTRRKNVVDNDDMAIMQPKPKRKE